MRLCGIRLIDPDHTLKTALNARFSFIYFHFFKFQAEIYRNSYQFKHSRPRFTHNPPDFSGMCAIGMPDSLARQLHCITQTLAQACELLRSLCAESAPARNFGLPYFLTHQAARTCTFQQGSESAQYRIGRPAFGVSIPVSFGGKQDANCSVAYHGLCS